jgi:hypothetical protein
LKSFFRVGVIELTCVARRFLTAGANGRARQMGKAAMSKILRVALLGAFTGLAMLTNAASREICSMQTQNVSESCEENVAGALLESRLFGP